jgi:hypothetical protein
LAMFDRRLNWQPDNCRRVTPVPCSEKHREQQTCPVSGLPWRQQP